MRIRPIAYRVLYFGFLIISCQQSMNMYQYIAAPKATPGAIHADSYITVTTVAVTTNPAPIKFPVLKLFTFVNYSTVTDLARFLG